MRLRAEEAFDARERAQLLADPLDLLRPLGAVGAQLREARPPGRVVGEELVGEAAALRLLGERRLEETDAPAADADAVREREPEGTAARILVHGDEARRAGAGAIELADAVAGRLRRDHDHVVPGGRDDPAEVDV